MAWEIYGIDDKSFNKKIENRYKRNFTGIQERTTDKKSILNQLKIINETIENYYYSD